MPANQIRVSYRVDVMLPHNVYAEYTGRDGVDLWYATALFNYLKWRKAGGRIVELPSGRVIDECKREYIPHSCEDFRNAIEQLKKNFGLAT
jgi:hypothetical protein